MRGGPPGKTKLDWAIELSAGWSRAALEGGDRVGLCTFDTRLVGQVKPGEGRPHFLKILDRLLDAKNVVDADLVDMTDGDLVAATARYLLHQEGVDLRLLRPPQDDAAWARVAAGPSGELYDLVAMRDLVLRLVASPRRRGAGGARDAAPDRPYTSGHWARIAQVSAGDGRAQDLDRLRGFCRARGIELPYRSAHDPGQRSGGFAGAIRRAIASERS